MRLVPYREDDADLPTLSRVEPDRQFVDERDKYFRIVDAKTVQTPGTPLTRLDREMYDILHTDALNDHDKWQIYNQILQKYLHKLPARPAEKKKIEPKKETDKNVIPISDDKILESVPKKFKNKAKKLLDFAKNVDNVEWDEKGLVKVNGEHIRNGNITDLINDAVRYRKNFTALGRQKFSSVMRQAGLPHEFVGNSQFWQEGSFVNNSIGNDASTSYRDNRMDIDTETSSEPESSPPPPVAPQRNHASASFAPVIRSSVLTPRRPISRKRSLEVTTGLNNTRIRKRRCIYQPMKKNYGGTWKRM